MRRLAKIGLSGIVAAIAAGLSGCGAARPAHYYSLGDFAASPAANGASYPIVLVVGRVTAPHLLNDDRIVYGTGPVEMGAYEYHRWIDPPPEMLEEAIVEQLRSTGQYKSVLRFTSRARGDYLLRGELLSLNELDSGGRVVARCAFRVELFESKTGNFVWGHNYVHEETVGRKTVDDVVGGLQRDVRTCLDELVAHLSAFFAAHPPKASD